MTATASKRAANDRQRDAERSREALLEAAETLFAERGYAGATLADIATEAGLSRGAPNYFFGSKEQLYIEVLDYAFAARQAATRAAFAKVHTWCRGSDGLDGLRRALAHAVDHYLRFLAGHPRFTRLVLQEEITGGRGLRARSQASTAMEDAFAALARAGEQRGLRRFDVVDAVLLFVGVTFTPFSLRYTLMRSLERDLEQPAQRRAHVELAVTELMHLLTGGTNR